MGVEEKLRSDKQNLRKSLHKIVRYLVKIIPIMIAGIYVLNTLLSYLGIDWAGFSYIVQFLFIGFMYIASYDYHFCKWHRMFIHYIFIILILNIVDYHYGIPLSDRDLFLGYGIITGLFLFIIVRLKLKCSERNKS